MKGCQVHLRVDFPMARERECRAFLHPLSTDSPDVQPPDLAWMLIPYNLLSQKVPMLHFVGLELLIILTIVVLLFDVDYISSLIKEAGKGIHSF